MTRLVVYGRSAFCPDMHRWRQWVDEHPLEYIEFDIDHDDRAHEKVLAWTGYEAVPTLVIAAEDGFDPVEPPEPRARDDAHRTESRPGGDLPQAARHPILRARRHSRRP